MVGSSFSFSDQTMMGIGAIPTLIIALVVGVPLYFIAGSFPLWVAAKIAVSQETTYGRAIKVLISQFLAGLIIALIGFMLAMIGGAIGGRSGIQAVSYLIYIATLVAGLMITARSYEIGVLHALGLQFLAGMIVLGIMLIGFACIGGVIGFARAKAPFEASAKGIQNTQPASLFSNIPMFSHTPPSPPDYADEIDGLLNAALHPTGPRPSLTEREDLVRILQQRLQAQRATLSPGDAHATLVYQNQFNRYLLLLDAVKAERKAQSAHEAVAGRKVAP